MFQSPKGRLQTFVFGNIYGWVNKFQSPKGRLQTGMTKLEFDVQFKGFNPQREGYKQDGKIGPAVIQACVSIPKGKATNDFKFRITRSKEI